MIKGGQGRNRREVLDSASIIAWCIGLGSILVAILAAWQGKR